jgi:hypothetical protein
MSRVTMDDVERIIRSGADVVCSGDQLAVCIYSERATASELGRIFDKEEKRLERNFG